MIAFVFSSFMLYGQTQKNDFVVVLDAGHGGKDTGNRGNGYFEKHIALNITKSIGAQLSKKKGIKVIYTRKDDRFIQLNNRAKIANQADADLFVSIHCDAFTSPKAYGAGTFVLGLHRTKDNFRIAKKENSVIFLEEDYETTYDGFDPNNPESVISLLLMQETYQGQSIEAASTIQKSFVTNLNRKDRTVKQAGFLVLRETYMPSVLVEVGFLTNKKEGQYLNSKKGQQEMATTIAQAILNYRNQRVASISSKPLEDKVMPKKPEPSKEDTPPPATTDEIIFKVQIAASSKSLKLTKSNFKGLKNLSVEKSGNLYRYFYGQTKLYKTAEKLKQKAVKAGYQHAFLVAYKAGIKIPMADAISQNK
ncbi:MAG: N-acetylmuramoyl-L-alanine amidase family protein [Flavobacteriaceae bacterium]